MNKYLIFLLGLMVFVAGCSSGSDGKQSGIGIGSSSGGSGNSGSGIELSFAENNPPSEMFKGQPYTFAFVLKNFQEHDITDLKLKTKGFDRGFVNGLQEEYSITKIPGASETLGAGLYTNLIASGVTVDNFVGDFNFNPEFDMCYTAKTTYREQVCVPSKLNQCETEVSKSLYKNGPVDVKVTYVNAIGDNVRVDFEVTNSGKGNVVNSCFNVEEYATKYSVKSSLGTLSGTCQATGTDELLLAGGKGGFYCEFPRSGTSSYASQLSVELEYVYEQTLKKSILVKDLNSGLN